MNSDAHWERIPEKKEIPMPILGDICRGKPCYSRRNNLENTIEAKSYSYSKKQNERTTVQKSHEATVDSNAIVSSTVMKFAVRGPNCAALSDNVVTKNHLKRLSNVSQKIFAQTMEIETKIVLRFGVLQRYITNSREKAVTLLKKKNPLDSKKDIGGSTKRLW